MSLPKITHVLELCLYCKQLPKSVAFYRDVLRLPGPTMDNERMAVFPLGQTTVILFQRGLTSEDSKLGPNGVIPGHGIEPGKGILDDVPPLKTHFALAVDTPDQVEEWARELKDKKVKVLGETSWPKGGKSVYFADPDDHVGEIGSHGIWDHY